MSKNDLAILGLLDEGEKYGYQIHQQITERNMDIWAKISISSIYNTLNMLRERGMVETRKLKVGKTPERNIYRITRLGEQMLTKLVESFLGTCEMGEYPFGLGLAFISSLPRQTAEGIIKQRISRLEEELTYLTERMSTLRDQIPLNWYLLNKNGCNHIESELKWCRELLREIKQVGSWEAFCSPRTEGGADHEK